MRTTFLSSWIGAMALAVGGCGAVGRSELAPPARSATARAVAPPKPPVAHAAVVRVARTAYGMAIADRRGFALYVFTHDAGRASTCYDACAAAWPPYVVPKRPSTAAGETRGGLVGSVRRRDGRIQVTFAGRPLYYYVGDRRPGQVLCQAVPEFGGTWYVIAPSGHAIH